MRFALLSLVLLVLAGCVVDRYDLQLPARPVEPLPQQVVDNLDYAVVSSATLTQTWTDDEVEVSTGELMVRVPGDDGRALGTPEEGEDELEAAGPPTGEIPVKFEYWRSKAAGPGPAPVVLVTPILGGGKRLARTNCRDFARAGMHVLLAWRGAKVLRSSWSLETVPKFMLRAMAARRGLIDWAETRPEIDSKRVAAFGISMGGILTSFLVAMEPRIHSAVIALAGGDLPGIIRTSDEGRLKRFRGKKMEELGLDEDAFEARLREALWTDPIELAASVDPRRVLLISTRYDEVVLPTYQERLWEAMGHPLRYDLPTGHYGGIIYLPYVTDVISTWFQRRLSIHAKD